MNGWSERRTGPRVEFRKDVRVIWSGQMRGVVAQAVNLSPTGILLDASTPEPCPVGADVLCDVALPNGSRLLRGRVAHTRVLATATVGLGIEFIDLSPHMVAELRDVVEDSEKQPHRVRVRFEGTRQIVSARAVPTADGFQLATSLPFLRLGAEVDITLSPETFAGAKGRVTAIALEQPSADSTPRLLIDVRVGETTAGDGRMGELPSATTGGEAALELGEPVEVVTEATLDAGVPVARPGDRTEIVRIVRPPPRRWPRAVGWASAVVLASVAIVVLGGRLSRSGDKPPVVRSAAAPVAPPSPPPAAAARSRVAPEPAAAAPETAPIVVPQPPPDPVPEPATFTVPLVGSLARAVRYPLRTPDGVAFNLPRARTSMRIGNYRPEVPGLRAIWVRPLPGGGTHLRFFFSEDAAAPEVDLLPDGVQVTAR